MALSPRRRKTSRRFLTSISALSVLYLSIRNPSSRDAFGADAALIPSYDGNGWGTSVYDFSPDLLKREDACSESLPGSVTSKCTPSNTTVTTLCCVRPDSVFPQCGVYLGVGFCVVDESGGSYTDSESVCDTDPNAVRCGTDDGDTHCCPEHTTCSDGGWGDGVVRCEAYTSDLEALTATSTTTSTTPTTTGTTTTTDSATTSSVSTTGGVLGKMTDIPQNNGNESDSKDDSDSLSGGAVAGIVIAVIAVLIILFLIAWFLLKRRKNSGPGNSWDAHSFFASDSKADPHVKYEMDAKDTAIPGPPHELDPQNHSCGTSLSRTPPQELPTPPVDNSSQYSVNARPQSPQEMEAPTSNPLRIQESQSR